MPRLIAPLVPIALVLFSGMLYQANASNTYNIEKAETAGVQSLVTQNCRPGNPTSRVYDQIGVDTKMAGGLIVRHPERLREVCGIINRSLVQVSFREWEKSRSLDEFGKERADNTSLLQLAADLRLSKEEATNLVRAHGRKVLDKVPSELTADAAETSLPAAIPTPQSTNSSTGLSLHGGGAPGLHLPSFSGTIGL